MQTIKKFHDIYYTADCAAQSSIDKTIQPRTATIFDLDFLLSTLAFLRGILLKRKYEREKAEAELF